MSRVVRNRPWRPPQVPLWVLPLVLLVAVWVVGAVRSLQESNGPDALAPGPVASHSVAVSP